MTWGIVLNLRVFHMQGTGRIEDSAHSPAAYVRIPRLMQLTLAADEPISLMLHFLSVLTIEAIWYNKPKRMHLTNSIHFYDNMPKHRTADFFYNCLDGT